MNGYKTCKRCGSLIGHEQGRTCPLTPELAEVLSTYALEHGRTWRAALRDLWTSGRDEGNLRQLRNIVGPGGLSRIDMERLHRSGRPKLGEAL